MPDRNSKYAAFPQADPDRQHDYQVTVAIGLIEAVEALAETRLVERVECFLNDKLTYCQECFRSGLQGGPIAHAASCCVGQALMAAKLLREALAAAALLRASNAANARKAQVADEAAGHAPVENPVEVENDAWHETRKYAAEVARNRAPGGILRPEAGAITRLRNEMEENFFAGAPVRKIVYDVCGVDALGGATHEEAASIPGGVFGEAAK